MNEKQLKNTKICGLRPYQVHFYKQVSKGKISQNFVAFSEYMNINIYTVAQCQHCYHQMALTRQTKKQPKPIQPTLASSQIKPWFQGQSHEAEILIAIPPPSCLPGSPSYLVQVLKSKKYKWIYPNTHPFLTIPACF